MCSLLICARSFLRSRTSFPRSMTIGRNPSSTRRNAANNPPGPAPTTITCGFPSTLLYIVRSYSSSCGISLMYALTFRLTKIVRWRASILRFKIRVAVMSRKFRPFSLERYSFNFCSFAAISGSIRSWYSCVI